MPDRSGAATLLAFDYGLRRIGIAVGQTITDSASPLGTIANRDTGPDLDRIAALIGEWRPDVLVVGLPLGADDSPGPMTEAALTFAETLRQFELPVATVDERYTSLEAGTALKQARQAGKRGRIHKEHIDAAAAVLIAERYLSQW